MSVETCAVVWDESCKAPANLDPPERARCTCFACGLPVCSACSRIRDYLWYGRKRICKTCDMDLDKV